MVTEEQRILAEIEAVQRELAGGGGTKSRGRIKSAKAMEAEEAEGVALARKRSRKAEPATEADHIAAEIARVQAELAALAASPTPAAAASAVDTSGTTKRRKKKHGDQGGDDGDAEAQATAAFLDRVPTLTEEELLVQIEAVHLIDI